MPVFPTLRAFVPGLRNSATKDRKNRRRRATRAYAIEWLETRDLPAVGFSGITLANQFNLNAGGLASIPPDTMGAVGPNHFVELINSSFAIYNKTTGNRVQYVEPDVLFASVRVGSTFDPRVVYDRESGRWFMTIMEFGTGTNTNNDVLLAVSKTSDPTYSGSPTTAWNFYRLGMNVATAFTDYSSLGVDSNGVYFGATYFPTSGSGFVRMFATPKASLIAASPSLGTVTSTGNIIDMFGTPQPVTSIDPVSGSTAAFFVASSATLFANVTYRSVTWSGSTPTFSATTTTLTTPSYGSVRNAPASGSTTAINVGDDRIQQVVQRNGKVYATRNVGVNSAGGGTSTTRTAAEWFQFDVSGTTLSLNQSGRVFDSATSNAFSYYYPSLTVTGQGIVRMAFSGSNATSFVSAFSTVHLPTDAAGVMSAPVAFVNGAASYTRLDTNGRNRWGDYSYTSLDPNDDMTVWTIQEYAAPNGQVGSSTVTSNWGTYIQSFDSLAPTLNNPSAVANQGTNGNILNLTGTNFYDPGAGYPNHISVSISGTGVTVTNVTYNSPTSVTVTYNVAAGATAGARNITLTNPDGQSATVNNGLTIQAATVTVSNVTSVSPNGTYGAGAVIPISIVFSGSVFVTGVPTLSLNSGGTATYFSGSGSSLLTFVYMVAAGQSSPDLDYVSPGALSLSGGTINDGSNNPATLTLPTPGSAGSLGANKSIVIDAIAPTVTGVSSTSANGSYGAGSVITITVGFSKSVVVSGTPTLALNSGGTATYFSGSGSPTLAFSYTVGAGQNANPLDAASAGALIGSIQDTVTNNPNAAVLTVPVAPTAGALGVNKSIVIDTAAPTVTGISSSNSNGTYGIGAVLTILVTFSENVVVTGTPTLALNSGGTANYTSGSGTSTLSFSYTVGVGQAANPLDAASAAALSGTIKDTVTNNPNAAVLTVPVAPASSALGVVKSLNIDGVAPSVAQYQVLFGTKSYNLIGSSRFDLPWQITGVRVVFSEPITTGVQASLDGLTTTGFTGLGTNTLVWTLNPTFQGSFATTLFGTGLNALKDAAGNSLGNGVNFAQAFKVLEGDFDDNGVVDSRDMVGINASISQPYNIFADINGDGVVDANDVKAARKRVGRTVS